MTPESVMEIGQQALYVAMMVAAPLLLTALAVGLLIGVIQAATQINEMTLSFIPKLIAMALVGLIAGPWMLRLLVQFTTGLIQSLPGAIRHRPLTLPSAQNRLPSHAGSCARSSAVT